MSLHIVRLTAAGGTEHRDQISRPRPFSQRHSGPGQPRFPFPSPGLFFPFSAQVVLPCLALQLPLPDHLSRTLTINAIRPVKDVDGLCRYNRADIIRAYHRPCTPLGILELLQRHQVKIAGQSYTGMEEITRSLFFSFAIIF